MAVMNFDELNTLSMANSHKRAGRKKIPIDNYFEDMQISEEEKEKRVRLANMLLADMLFLFALSKRIPDKKYLSETLENRYIDSVKTITEPDKKMRRYIKKVSENIVDVTQNHPKDDYYTSIDRATNVAENEANTILNSDEYGAAVNSGYTKKTWITYRDERVRQSHTEIDGEVIGIEQPFHVGDSLMMYPKDDSLGAGLEEIVNCRCSVRYLHQATKKLQENDSSEARKESNDNEKSFLDVTGEYLDRAKGKRGTVVDIKKYEKDGNIYVVDGKQVLLDYSDGEKGIAEFLAASLGVEVKMIPRVLSPQKVSTADIMLNGETFDIKEPIGHGKAVIYNMVAKKKRQANNFVIDISNCPLTIEEIRKQIADVYHSSHTRFIDKIILTKDKRILNVYKRTDKEE